MRTKIIESKSPVLTPSKSTFADNKEQAPYKLSNTDATVCEHEQALYEDERINVTKKAQRFKCHEELEDSKTQTAVFQLSETRQSPKDDDEEIVQDRPE